MNVKNSYLSFEVCDSENILYSVNVKDNCKNIFDSVMIGDFSENIYRSIGVYKSSSIFFSKFIFNSNNIWFSSNLVGCTECLFCTQLENVSYAIANKKYSKEDYLVLKEKIIEHMKNTGESLF